LKLLLGMPERIYIQQLRDYKIASESFFSMQERSFFLVNFFKFLWLTLQNSKQIFLLGV
jgi:hypothetical protein